MTFQMCFEIFILQSQINLILAWDWKFFIDQDGLKIWSREFKILWDLFQVFLLLLILLDPIYGEPQSQT